MTIRLEEIVYLHCHQQGKGRAGGVITPALARVDLWGVPVWGCFESAPGQMSRALGGHCGVSASSKSMKAAPGCCVCLGGLPAKQYSAFPGLRSAGEAFSRARTFNGLREESKQGRKSFFSIPERQAPELSCMPSAFLPGNVSLTRVCVFSLLSLSLTVDSGGTVVLVSQDGIQRPPLRFPRGGHLLQFLSCLENGLLPHGQLDPPLWSQRGKVGTQNRARS